MEKEYSNSSRTDSSGLKMSGNPAMQYRPSLNGPCLCGSGKKFKRCCLDHYEGSNPASGPTEALISEDYSAALRECRATITKYTIWHKSHTEPAIRAGIKDIDQLTSIDIRALGDLVDRLLYCYRKLDRLEEFPEVLERLRTNIRDDRWNRKIAYFHALCALGSGWNERAGRRELKRIGSVDDETDPEILQLYIDLFGSKLNFSKMLALTNQAIKISEKPIDVFHYRCLRAMLFFTVSDIAEAAEELSAAIAEFRLHYKVTLTSYESYRFALGIQYLGALKGDTKLLDEAADLLHQALKFDDWLPEGRAEVQRAIGESLRLQEKWEEALAMYEKSWAIAPVPICKISICECLIQLNRADEARRKILSIDEKKLPSPTYADYVFTSAVIAIETKTEGLIEKTEQQLRELEFREPYFRERRDSLLLRLLEAREKRMAPGTSGTVKKLLREILSRGRRYMIVQPNFMGIGIDLGKIADDISSGADFHDKEGTSDQDEKNRQPRC